jgi:hypothetical protein
MSSNAWDIDPNEESQNKMLRLLYFDDAYDDITDQEINEYYVNQVTQDEFYEYFYKFVANNNDYDETGEVGNNQQDAGEGSVLADGEGRDTGSSVDNEGAEEADRADEREAETPEESAGSIGYGQNDQGGRGQNAERVAGVTQEIPSKSLEQRIKEAEAELKKKQEAYSRLYGNFLSLKKKAEKDPNYGMSGQVDIFGNVSGSDNLFAGNEREINSGIRQVVLKAELQAEEAERELKEAQKKFDRLRDEQFNRRIGQKNIFGGEESLKEKQFSIIQASNPMKDDIHTGIRSADEILTAEEAFSPLIESGDEASPDFTAADMADALKSGQITVYSSYPITNGVFVTPSRMMAEDYAGEKNVYSARVPINSVAWIDETEGQMADVDEQITTNDLVVNERGATLAKNKPNEKVTNNYNDRKQALTQEADKVIKEVDWKPTKNGNNANQEIDKKEKLEDFGEKIGGARKDMGITRKARDTDSLPAWRRKYRYANADSKITIGDKVNTDSPFSVVYVHKSGNRESLRTVTDIFSKGWNPKIFNSEQEAEDYIPIFEANLQGFKVLKKSENEYVISKISSTGKIIEFVSFPTREEAEAYLRSTEGATSLLNRKREDFSIPALENVERTGKDYRKGRNISTDEFMKTFGFRGGEFGNWVKPEERQTMLNMAYDSFMDMTDILGISPRAISLNGELGIAFGSRGIAAASAHFEPLRAVINLTRMNGAGSLAHEWAHALDNYFGLQAANKNYAKDKNGELIAGRVFKSESDLSYIQNGMRDELRRIFENIVKSTQKKKAPQDVAIEKLQNQYANILKHVDREANSLVNKFELGVKRYKYDRKKNEHQNIVIKGTADQVKKVRELVEKISSGNGDTPKWNYIPGKKNKISYISTELLDIDKLHKDVFGKSGIEKDSDGFYNFAYYATKLYETKERLDKAKDGGDPDVEIETEYMENSKKFDKSRAKPYWSTKVEMFARAFEYYIQSNLDDKGIKSDYLQYDKAPVYMELYDMTPYPMGEERTYLNKLFKDFFDTVQEKVDEETGNVALFRTGESKESLAKRELKKGISALEKILQKMGVDVEILETTEGLTGKYATAKGWYDPKTGKITIVVPNHSSSLDIQYTLLHEAVGHYGLRKLFGNDFNAFLDDVYNSAEDRIKQEINAISEGSKINIRTATEEYLSKLAEDREIMDTDKYGHNSFLNKVKKFFMDMLAKIGFDPGFKLSDNELKYILWRSYQNLSNSGKDKNIISIANDVAMQSRLKVGNYAEKGNKSNVAEEPIRSLPGTFDPENNDIRFRMLDESGYYSTVEKALSKIQQEKGTKDQFKAMLLKNGAKQAEMDWMGWDETFTGKSVTKAEIQDWINQNKIEISEVRKEKNEPLTEGEIIQREQDIYINADIATREKFGIDEPIERWDEYYKGDADEDILNEIAAKNGYSDYKKMFDAMDLYYEDLVYEELSELDRSREDSTKYSNYILPGGEKYNELLLTMPRKRYRADETKEPYKSPHFDEPNIVAHIRFDERTANGERILFIEELQSDWQQSGKKKGFIDNSEYKAIPDGENKWDVGGIKVLYFEKGVDGKNYRTINKQNDQVWFSTLEEAIKEASSTAKYRFKDREIGKVPNMPFKKTDQWITLAFRRMMRYAAENGFDRIAWTNGEQQAERYDLSKQVDEIKVIRDGDTYTLYPIRNNQQLAEYKNLKGEELEEYVGKDLASKIISDKIKDGETKSYSGIDLKVGGTGMKSFYDMIVPTVANKIAKPFGAKVETIKMETGEQQSIPVTDKMIENLIEEGIPLFKSTNKRNYSELLSLQTKFDNAVNDDDKHDAAVDIVEIINESFNADVRTVPVRNKRSLIQTLRNYGADEEQISSFENNDEPIQGAYYNGLVILNTSDIESSDELLSTWIHETMHHYTENNKGILLSLSGKVPKAVFGEVLPESYARLSESKKINELLSFLAERIVNGEELPDYDVVNDEIKPIIDNFLNQITNGRYKNYQDVQLERQAIADSYDNIERGVQQTSRDVGERTGTGKSGTNDRVGGSGRERNKATEEARIRAADNLYNNIDNIGNVIDYDKFLSDVLEGMPNKNEFLSNVEITSLDKAIENYLANVEDKNELQRIKDILGVDMPDIALQYLLWRNANKDDGSYEWKAKNALKKQDLNANVLFRKGQKPKPDKTNIYENRIRSRYNRGFKSLMYGIEEGYIDRMNSLRVLQEAITGNQAIPEKANAYMLENQLSSRNTAQIDYFNKHYINPIVEQIHSFFGKGKDTMRNADDYMIAKHGLERNEHMANKMYEEWYDKKLYEILASNTDNAKKEKLIESLNKQGEKKLAELLSKDYSGLTALAKENGREDFTEYAKELVEKVESKHSEQEIKDFWDSINNATKTMLEKQYDSGMISKEVYENVRDMYKYYVPLRGFDELIATDLYDYIEHKPTDFNRVMKKAYGRTSRADSPLLSIMNMGESGIMQCNRNRMKMAFYRLVSTNPSNYATIEDVWHVKTSDGWEERFPDISPDATGDEVAEAIADFNNEMAELEEQEIGRAHV